MEVGIHSAMPTYSGGLGVLSGDTIKAAADVELPFVAVTLAHRAGYFRQHLDAEGRQNEEPASWNPAEHMGLVEERVTVEVEGRAVVVCAWRLDVVGVTGHVVPVYFLDTELEENSAEDRRITDHLYGGDQRDRLRQEIVLGIGGVKMLRAVGLEGLDTFHMNEGHSALLGLALLEERTSSGGVEEVAQGLDAVRAACVFTTHTPVPAGHDVFSIGLFEEVLGPTRTALLKEIDVVEDGAINMTRLALRLSRYCNGVAMRHAQVSGEMFPDYHIHPITNGVHAATWTGAPMQGVFDEYLPAWREDPYLLRHAVDIPLERIRRAQREAKEALLAEVEQRTGKALDPDRLTLGFARRAAPYKRADLLMRDPERLRAMARASGGLQILYSGKAHPRNNEGKEMIRRVIEVAGLLEGDLGFAYLEDYDMHLGGLLTAGVDVWLNNPVKPLEASGTSGMKAALNGVPCLSVLDGWWIEGHVEGVTGWAIGTGWDQPSVTEEEVASLLDQLEGVVLPLYYHDPEGWARVMRSSIALNGSHFHARRMMHEYQARAYRTA